jgi:hypothetical protein
VGLGAGGKKRNYYGVIFRIDNGEIVTTHNEYSSSGVAREGAVVKYYNTLDSEIDLCGSISFRNCIRLNCSVFRS